MNYKFLFCVLIVTIFNLKSNAQEKLMPADKALAAIDAIINFKAEILVATRLACLTQIFPKEINLNYVGVCYRPTTIELERWKTWIEENRKNLLFEKEEPNEKFNFITGDFNIIYIGKDGKIRDSYCR